MLPAARISLRFVQPHPQVPSKEWMPLNELVSEAWFPDAHLYRAKHTHCQVHTLTSPGEGASPAHVRESLSPGPHPSPPGIHQPRRVQGQQERIIMEFYEFYVALCNRSPRSLTAEDTRLATRGSTCSRRALETCKPARPVPTKPPL